MGGKEDAPKPKSAQPSKWEIEQAWQHGMNNLSNEADERAAEEEQLNETVSKLIPTPQKPAIPAKRSRQQEINKQLEEWSPW